MKNLELAIPFDEEVLNENILKRLLNKCKKFIKTCFIRGTDIIISVLGFTILIPMTVLVKLIYLKNKDFKSIFYTTECIGKDGKIFKVIKYRSINKYGISNKLRRTGLDNLPKLINVFLGDMALVGPQPYLAQDKEKMGTYYNRIIQMKPGITGIYQISLAKDKSFEKRLDDDIKYFYRKNVWMDFKVILITLLITIPTRNKGEIFSFLNVTVKDIGRAIIKAIDTIFKRCIDILGAIVGILILIPMVVVVAVINLFSGDKGPIFYSQERIGKNGKYFKMYKFRSMVVGADEELKKLLAENPRANAEYKRYKKLKDDPRITKIGGFLRKTSLDEFPQFINVLKGEMSLVGPRPYLERELDDMSNYYDIVIKHKPGITGLWQISGRSEVTFKERLDMDLEYHKKCNVRNDIKILFKTAINVLKHEGAA